jgi:hypothetical protein
MWSLHKKNILEVSGNFEKLRHWIHSEYKDILTYSITARKYNVYTLYSMYSMYVKRYQRSSAAQALGAILDKDMYVPKANQYAGRLLPMLTASIE